MSKIFISAVMATVIFTTGCPSDWQREEARLRKIGATIDRLHQTALDLAKQGKLSRKTVVTINNDILPLVERLLSSYATWVNVLRLHQEAGQPLSDEEKAQIKSEIKKLVSELIQAAATLAKIIHSDPGPETSQLIPLYHRTVELAKEMHSLCLSRSYAGRCQEEPKRK